MRSDVYEDLRSYAESAGMKVYTLTNLLVETGLKMLKEGISPSEVLIMYKVLDTLTRFVEIKPKGGWGGTGDKPSAPSSRELLTKGTSIWP
jgi:hypothetical protein